jgi:KUP system potassium uptake protein
LLPRFEVRRTSETEKGQIYIPKLNWLLLLAVVFLVIVFKSSSALASAYGIAVTGTMVVTSIMAFFLMWRCWHWPVTVAALVITPFLAVDLVFLMANLLKVFEGGWMPLAVGASLLVVMLTWRRGTRLLREKVVKTEVDLREFIQMIEARSPERVQGIAVFLTGHPDHVPSALLHNLKHNKVLHQQNVILSIVTEDMPRVGDENRAEVERLSDHFSRVKLHFGFMETPNVPHGLRACGRLGWRFDIMRTSFFLSRRALRAASNSAMPRWQDSLFIHLARSANDASAYFQIPTGRAVEVGTQVAI